MEPHAYTLPLRREGPLVAGPHWASGPVLARSLGRQILAKFEPLLRLRFVPFNHNTVDVSRCVVFQNPSSSPSESAEKIIIKPSRNPFSALALPGDPRTIPQPRRGPASPL